MNKTYIYVIAMLNDDILLKDYTVNNVTKL